MHKAIAWNINCHYLRGMNQQEAFAILEWYVAMGVVETQSEAVFDWKKITQKITTKAAPSFSATATASHTPAFSASPLRVMEAPPPPASSDTLIAETSALAAQATSLAELEHAVRSYRGLSLCRTATQPVFAEGVASAPLMVIGEAPGAEEDRHGTPFSGVGGQLLNRMLASIGFSRSENCYLTNTVFWRPPGNRTPSLEEIHVCRPLVEKHIALINPQVIFLVGGVAVRAILDDETPISRLRGKAKIYHSNLLNKDIPVIVSYHPSHLLRQPLQKKLAWQDILALKEQTFVV
jgi:DNA polymerase